MQKIILYSISLTEFVSILNDSIAEQLHKHNLKTDSEGEKLLSPEEARKVWQPAISKVTLHRWTKDGLVPVHRIGGRVYYKHSEIIKSVKEIRMYERNRKTGPDGQ